MNMVDLFKTIKQHENCPVLINMCSIVNRKVLTDVSWVSRIEKSLFINFEGKYAMGDNALDFYAQEGREGLLIKFINGVTLFFQTMQKRNMMKLKVFMFSI